MTGPSASLLTEPNLLIAGFAKCGTTSLAKYLADHPDVCPPSVKETYFLVDATSPFAEMNSFFGEIGIADDDINATSNFSRFIEQYNGETCLFDATPYHYCQERALSYAERRPDLKVVFIVREPEDRLQSSYSFFKNVQQEYPDVTFEDYVDIILGDEATRAAFRARIKRPFFQAVFDTDLTLGCYATHIEPWINRLGRDRVFVGKMETMRDEPQRFMRDLCQFLAIDASFYEHYEFQVYQKTFNVRFPVLQRFVRRLVKSDPMRMDTLAKHHNSVHLIGNPVVRAVADRLYRFIQGADQSVKIDSPASKRLAAYYAASDRRLRDICNLEPYGAG